MASVAVPVAVVEALDKVAMIQLFVVASVAVIAALEEVAAEDKFELQLLNFPSARKTGSFLGQRCSINQIMTIYCLYIFMENLLQFKQFSESVLSRQFLLNP